MAGGAAGGPPAAAATPAIWRASVSRSCAMCFAGSTSRGASPASALAWVAVLEGDVIDHNVLILEREHF